MIWVNKISVLFTLLICFGMVKSNLWDNLYSNQIAEKSDDKIFNDSSQSELQSISFFYNRSKNI